MKVIYVSSYACSIDRLWLAATEAGVCGIGFESVQKFESFSAPRPEHEIKHAENDLIVQLIARHEENFNERPEPFDLPLDVTGSPFQLRVWQALRRIPYGRQRSYRQIAAEIGAPGAVRAVGNANHANPTPIIVPCHRVTRSDGSLGGYAGGLGIKEALLRLEGTI